MYKDFGTVSIRDFEHVVSRISPYIIATPLIKIPEFDKDTGHDVLFKLENLQVTGSFKSRGVLNYIQNYISTFSPLNKKFLSYGTGNHGAALAWSGQRFNFVSHIFLSKFAEKYKMNLIERYGGILTICEDRKEAEEAVFEEAKKDNNILIPTADNLDVITGAGTVLYEALQQPDGFDAVFLPIGGGSLASGSLLVRKALNSKIRIFAGEPAAANDVAISLKQGKVFRFNKEPNTIADAAKTLGVSENIFSMVKLLDGVYEISEQEILYWTNYFAQFSSYSCEPTSSLAIASAYRWLQTQKSRKQVVIIISGDNVRSNLKNIVNLDPKIFYEALI